MTFKMKKVPGLALIGLVTASLALGNCKKNEKDDTAMLALLALGANAKCVTTLDADVSSSRTISGSVCLTATIFVRSGATLTVLPGTKVYGTTGSAIFVLKGAKLVAEGTAAQPIVFTSLKDDGSRTPGDWGGILLIGKATTSASSVQQTEGTDKQPYGPGVGTDNDSSGSLKYVRVEFAGTKIATGDELNGISLYAVGSGTTLDHVQVHMGNDDNFEFFGGTVNGTYIVSSGFGDDGIDIDEGYKGTISNLVVYAYPDGTGMTGAANDPRSFELDGAKKGTQGHDPTRASVFTITKFTSVGETPASTGLKLAGFRDCVTANMTKGVFVNYTAYGIDASTSDCAANQDGSGSPAPTVNWTTVSIEGGALASTGTPATQNGAVTTGASQSAYLTRKWDKNNPATAPGFVVNVANSAFEGETSDWTAGWTNWVNN